MKWILPVFAGVMVSGWVAAGTPAARTTYVYQCDGAESHIVVTLAGEGGHLFAPRKSEPLVKRADGSGYSGEGVSYAPDQPVDLAPGQTATIVVEDRTYTDCRNDTRAAVWENAKLRGVSYRAVGQEPPFVLEVDRSRGFLLVTAYGEQQRRFPYTEPLSDPAERSANYRSAADGESIEITVIGESCRDSMSGEAFSSRVEIDWQGRLLRGCGRALH